MFDSFHANKYKENMTTLSQLQHRPTLRESLHRSVKPVPFSSNWALLDLSLLVLIAVLISGCTAQPMKQVKVGSYNFRAVAQDIIEGRCFLGNSPYSFSSNYSYKKEYQTGTSGIWVADLYQTPYKVRCTWKAADGTPREESANLAELLLPPYFKWDFEDVEILKEQPIQLNTPNVHVELRDRTFRIVTKAKVQYLGEILPNGSTRVLMRDVAHILYERSGQQGK